METLEAKTGYEAALKEYVDREKASVDLLNSVGKLMYERGVELFFFRNHLLDVSISQVLALLERGGLKLEARPVHLGAVIRQVIAELAPEALARDIEIEYSATMPW